jgi:hypothetical protein
MLLFPSLSLLVPNSRHTYRHLFFSPEPCPWGRDRSHFPSPWREGRPFHMSGQTFLVPRRKTRLLTSRSSVRESAWRPWWTPSRILDVAALILFGPLFHCCSADLFIVSSWTSVLYERAPFAVQERRGGSSVYGQRPSSSGTHHPPPSCPHSSWFLPE